MARYFPGQGRANVAAADVATMKPSLGIWSTRCRYELARRPVVLADPVCRHLLSDLPHHLFADQAVGGLARFPVPHVGVVVGVEVQDVSATIAARTAHAGAVAVRLSSGSDRRDCLNDLVSPGKQNAGRVSAGRRLVSPAKSWWPGAGSNRRPSAFQADARTN